MLVRNLTVCVMSRPLLSGIQQAAERTDTQTHRQTDRNRKVRQAEGERWIDMDAVATTISVCAPFIWQQIRETCHI